MLKLLPILVLCLALPAWGAVAAVGSAQGFATSSPAAATYTPTGGAGHTLVITVGILGTNGTVTSIAVGAKSAIKRNACGTTLREEIWTVTDIAATDTNPSVTIGGTFTNAAVMVTELSGVTRLGGSVCKNATGTSVTDGVTGVPLTGDFAVVGVAVSGNTTFTAVTPATVLQSGVSADTLLSAAINQNTGTARGAVTDTMTISSLPWQLVSLAVSSYTDPLQAGSARASNATEAWFNLGSGAADFVVPYQGANAAGSLLVAAVRTSSGAGTPNITVNSDAVGNANWACVTKQADANAYTIYLCYNWNAGAGTNYVSFHTSATSTITTVGLIEYTSAKTSATAFDVGTQATGTSTTPASGNASATTENNELLIGLASGQRTDLAPSGSWAARLKFSGGTLEMIDQVVSGTKGTQYSATWTMTSGYWGALIATFKDASQPVRRIIPAQVY